MDLALEWGTGAADVAVRDDDLVGDDGLVTAVLLSLFLDRRAEDDDDVPGDAGDRRGWWADEFSRVAGDRIGSRLWLLDRSARRSDVQRDAEAYAREALAWMVDDHVAEKINVTVEVGAASLFFAVEIIRPIGDPVSVRYAHAWEAMR